MNGVARQRSIWGAVIALGALLSGCAVLTIDVDVYKGSLINEEHVQMHQLLTLTTAAKPMLVQVRDTLEWPKNDGDPPVDTTWHQRGYVTPPIKITDSNFFKKQHARKVNIILSLYEDLSSPDLFPYGNNLTEALERFQSAKVDLEVSQKRDREIYDDIEAGFKPDKDFTDSPTQLRQLKQGYKELFFPSPGEEGKLESKVARLMDALVSMSKENQGFEKKNDQQTYGLEAGLMKEWKGSPENENNDSHLAQQLLVQAVWKYLWEEEEDTLLARATNQLCIEGPQGHRACSELSKRTKKLADAYWEARASIREMWEESLSLLMRIEHLERGEPSRYRALKENVIVLVVELTSVHQMASVLDHLGENCSGSQNVLKRESVCEAQNSNEAKRKREWTEARVKEDPERFKEILRRELSAEPTDMAHFLLGLDSMVKEGFLPDGNKIRHLIEKANNDNSQRVVRLGLNRGPMDDQGKKIRRKCLRL